MLSEEAVHEALTKLELLATNLKMVGDTSSLAWTTIAHKIDALWFVLEEPHAQLGPFLDKVDRLRAEIAAAQEHVN